MWGPLKERIVQEAGFGPAEALWLDLYTTRRSEVSAQSTMLRSGLARIDAIWEDNRGGFDDILLVGHSMGGLIVRQAYLLAAGAVPGQPASPWAEAR